MISRENYESYIVDYADGNLSPEQIAELLLFLEQNQDLKEEFERFEKIQLIPDSILYSQKDALKKQIDNQQINPINYEELFIAYHERDLTKQEQKSVENFIEQNPQKRTSFEILKQCRLEADTNIVFPLKSRLKKSVFDKQIKRVLYFSLSLAASLIVIFFTRISIDKAFFETTTFVSKQNSKSTNIKPLIEKESDEVLVQEKEVAVIQIKKKHSSKTKMIPNKNYNISQELIIDELPLHKELPESTAFISEKEDDEKGILPVDKDSNRESVKNIQEDELLAKEDEYMDLKQFATLSILKRLNESEKTQRNREITLWDLAEAGSNVLSRITGKRIQINRSIEENGNKTQLAFVAGKIEFTKTINK